MLPKIVPLSRKIHLPIEDKDVKVYAYTLSEEKLLLLNKEEDGLAIENVLLDIIQAKTDWNDVKSLTMVDIIFMLLNIIDISKGLSKDLSYKCMTKNTNNERCDNIINVSVDMNDYKIHNPNNNHKLVKVNDSIACELIYPSYYTIEYLQQFKDEGEYTIRLYSKLISTVYHNDDVITDFTDDEIYEWVLNLPINVLDDFRTFVSNIPTITLEYEVKCDKCGNSQKFITSNILDFFI